MSPETAGAAAFLAGLVTGVGVDALLGRRVERALRLFLDKREAELAEARAELQRTVDRVVSLRKDGYVMSRAGVVQVAPDPDGAALARAEESRRRQLRDVAFLENAAADLRKKRPDLGAKAIEREAHRLLEAARMEQPPA